MNRLLTFIVASAISASVGTFSACDKKEPGAATKHGDHDHAHGEDDHDHKAKEGHDDHGAVTQLGEQVVGGFTVKASRDGDIKPGGDAPIDVWITPSAATSAKVAAVRFWIGTEDAKGSVKAKAEVENAADPDRWHVHAEIPNPMPEGSMLWVEIEDDKGAISIGSFDLRM